ncbi:MAG TPA: hypothetical protein VJP40_00820, partial [bacterium]|nr:hypothetical protein [bacterium]
MKSVESFPILSMQSSLRRGVRADYGEAQDWSLFDSLVQRRDRKVELNKSRFDAFSGGVLAIHHHDHGLGKAKLSLILYMVAMGVALLLIANPAAWAQ